MGRKRTQNFNKRFGDRVTVTYRQKPFEPEESQIHNSKLLKAFTQVFTGILEREPTQEELLGIADISVCKQLRGKQITDPSVSAP